VSCINKTHQNVGPCHEVCKAFFSLLDYYFGMSNKTKPLIVIVVAVVLAAGIAVYWSRQSSASDTGSSSNTSIVVNPGGGHIRGNASAPLTLVEFGDYECPACGYYYPMVEEVLRRYPDKVKLEFHHYPLIQMHAHALAAAMAAEAAGDQGKYWEMHDLLYKNQAVWARNPNPESQFLAFAADLGLDANKFMRSLKSPDVEKRILEDIQRGGVAKVNSTPTFIINGRSIDPLPKGVDEFATLIDSPPQAAK
jgi:protein-disulfide isomerase